MATKLAYTSDPYKTTFHRDGTVTVWNVYTQTWMRRDAGSFPNEVLASLNSNERRRIERLAQEVR